MNVLKFTLVMGVMINAALYLSLAEAAPSSAPQNLKDIYQAALQHDATWAAARYSNQAAQERLVQGRAQLLPTVSMNGGVNHSDTTIRYIGGNTVYKNNNQPESFDTVTYGLNVNQPLYNKARYTQYQQSSLQVRMADFQLAQDRQDVMMKSAQAYFDVLLAQDKFTLIQAQKIAIASQLAQAKATYKAGVSPITDVDEAQAKFDLVRSQEIATMNEWENKKRAVQILTGQYPETLYGVSPELTLSLPVAPHSAEQGVYPNSIEAWLQQAQTNGYLLNIKRMALELATKEVELNQAGHLPTLDAVASYNRTNANGGINGFGSDLNNTTVGVQVQIPIYQGGAVSSKVRESVANQEKAREELEAITRKTEMDARQAYLDIASAIAQAQSGEQALRSTQSLLKSTEMSFKVGVRTNVDVLNAQQQVFNAKRDLLQARYAYLLGLLKLQYACGLLQDDSMEEVNRQLVLE